jgi:hypothetical protein
MLAFDEPFVLMRQTRQLRVQARETPYVVS